MVWVGGCKHHCAEGVACFWRGRRLRDAYVFAMNLADAMLEEGNGWEMQTYGGFLGIWQEGVGSVGGLYAGIKAALGYLDTLPWLLVRLDEPGIAQRCRDLWAATPRADHHPVTIEFMDPEHTSGLRAMVDAINELAEGICAFLRRAIDALQAIPLDDMVAEGPHAIAKRIIERAVGGSFSWTASTARLERNLELATTLPAAFGADLQTEWDRWSSVIKTKNVLTARRMKRPEVCDHICIYIYTCIYVYTLTPT